MVIAGAGGHAKEILGILLEQGETGDIFFYDDTARAGGDLLLNRFEILTNAAAAAEAFRKDPRFVLGTGKPSVRKLLAEKLTGAGGRLISVVSPHAKLGNLGVQLGEGLNIMTGAVITGPAVIGRGALVHIHCSIHHDTVVGDYAELSPGCRILGAANIGAGASIGANAVILPGISVGEGAVIGAGAVVTKPVAAGNKMAGVPARSLDK